MGLYIQTAASAHAVFITVWIHCMLIISGTWLSWWKKQSSLCRSPVALVHMTASATVQRCFVVHWQLNYGTTEGCVAVEKGVWRSGTHGCIVNAPIAHFTAYLRTEFMLRWRPTNTKQVSVHAYVCVSTPNVCHTHRKLIIEVDLLPYITWSKGRRL